MPSGRTLMLAGLRSRCTIPCSCAASSASAICRASASASVERHRPVGDALREVLALDQLHHDRADAVAVLQAVDRRDVGMVQRRQHLGFALEARQALGIGGERRRQDLDRHLALEPRVGGAIDLAHTAGAERRDDLGTDRDGYRE